MKVLKELHALLAALGRGRPEDEISVLSGAAFRWYYADRDGFDARTAPCELDVVARGLAAVGVSGRQGAGAPDCGLVAAFLVEGLGDEPPPPVRLRSVLEAAGILSRPGTFTPPDGEPIPRGPDAYEALIEDLLLGRGIAEGERPGRMGAALAGLAHDRRVASAFLGMVSEDPTTFEIDGDLASRIGQAGRAFAEVSDMAGDLCGRVFRSAPDGPETADAIASRVEADTALVIEIGDVEPVVREALATEGLAVVDTDLGTAVVVDDPERRGMAARLAATIRDRDADAFGLLA
jgi:hypothetical protein